MKGINPNLAIVGGVVLLVYLMQQSAGKALASVGAAVNPVNRDNIVNRGFHGVYNVFTDGRGSLGTDIYDWLHPEGL